MTSTHPESNLPAESSSPAAGPAPEEASDAYRVSVGEFEGPLDLLLHLVRINEVEIADIPIVEITDQYNAHLELMQEMRLDVAGEYLVMAATLMHIKSKMLLPPDPTLEDEEEAADPRAQLAQQLIEYQRFKQAAENLEAMDSRRSLIYTRDHVHAEFEGEELLAVDLHDLMKAFGKLLGRLDAEARHQLKRDNVSVADKIHWLGELLERRRSIDLFELLSDLPSQLERIATFLAVLEMMRLQLLLAFQRKAFDEIRIARIEEPPSEPASPHDGMQTETT